ncbi:MULTISPECIES: TRAP transporter small permease [Vibrio]|uniref:TRAP transporter small permease protein n=1 Tax=Vibrio ostreae TaxID=2841925 RepID=A0A975U9I7_9VIBR|nr:MULTISPECIES: TRAP transporter small permease [Vibrio]QXO16409.1 TRAP transporter small permease [Vibrio ostreae]WGY45293.1 TRAP transporter small permease [Vibrio sp. ABG19]
MKYLTLLMAKLQLTIGAVCLVIFVVATLVQVATRYLGISVLWTEEVAVNAFIWAMFLGAAVMVRENEHFSFRILTDKFEGNKRSCLLLVQNLIMLVFCILCSVYSVEITQTFWNSRWITVPEFKQGYIWLVMPVTFISSSVYLVDNMIKEVAKLRNASKKGVVWNSH